MHSHRGHRAHRAESSTFHLFDTKDVPEPGSRIATSGRIGNMHPLAEEACDLRGGAKIIGITWAAFASIDIATDFIEGIHGVGAERRCANAAARGRATEPGRPERC